VDVAAFADFDSGGDWRCRFELALLDQTRACVVNVIAVYLFDNLDGYYVQFVVVDVVD
jgi:hypothetical protein